MKLTDYHPIIIEGMGGYDVRDPDQIAQHLTGRLLAHWDHTPPARPLLILTQGDPLEPRGISAITPRVAKLLDLQRGLVYLDENIADYHWPNADRDNMALEQKYSQLVKKLSNRLPDAIHRIESAIDNQIKQKNYQRAKLGQQPLAEYFRDFALLQEVTKAACSILCEGITIIHTSAEISPFSVTSFYKVGLELGLVGTNSMVSYSPPSENQ